MQFFVPVSLRIHACIPARSRNNPTWPSLHEFIFGSKGKCTNVRVLCVRVAKCTMNLLALGSEGYSH